MSFFKHKRFRNGRTLNSRGSVHFSEMLVQDLDRDFQIKNAYTVLTCLFSQGTSLAARLLFNCRERSRYDRLEERLNTCFSQWYRPAAAMEK